nr:hypothetical protein [Nocardioidaceae bacterium]
MFRAAPRAAGLALLLILTACGGSEDEQAADAVAESLMDEEEASLELTQEEADCVGAGFVDQLGADKLTEYGIVTEDLSASDEPVDVKMSDGDAAAAAGVMVGCADAARLMKDAVRAGAQVDPAAEACLDETVTEDSVEEFLTAVFSGAG